MVEHLRTLTNMYQKNEKRIQTDKFEMDHKCKFLTSLSYFRRNIQNRVSYVSLKVLSSIVQPMLKTFLR